MKILITGAGGYLGRGLIEAFAGEQLRLMDVVPFATPRELVIGDVADLATVRQAVAGIDGILIAHMASRQAGAYRTPEAAFDVNVKGTANLFFAAAEQGVRRVVLISSFGATLGYSQDQFKTRDLPPRGADLYSLTKACQEVIAEQYHRTHGLQVAVFRPNYIMNADTMRNKYGEELTVRLEGLIDPRDIGEAARLAFALPDLGYEVFYISGTAESDHVCDVAYSRERLGWTPRHDFSELPPAE